MADELPPKISQTFVRLVALDPDTGELRQFKIEDDLLRIQNWVYNIGSGEWERMKQPQLEVGDLTVTMGDVEKLLAGNYWKDQRFEYSSGDLIYRGFNTTHKAATSSATWHIWKYTYSNGDLIRLEGPLVGAWETKGSLGWG